MRQLYLPSGIYCPQTILDAEKVCRKETSVKTVLLLWQTASQLNTKSPQDPATPPLGMCPRRPRTGSPRPLCGDVHTGSLTTARRSEQWQSLSRADRTHTMLCLHVIERYCSPKGKQLRFPLQRGWASRTLC